MLHGITQRDIQHFLIEMVKPTLQDKVLLTLLKVVTLILEICLPIENLLL